MLEISGFGPGWVVDANEDSLQVSITDLIDYFF